MKESAQKTGQFNIRALACHTFGRGECLLLSLCLLFIPKPCAASAAADEPMGVERVARLTPLGYQSLPADKANEIRWVQVDLGASRRIQMVKLFPKLFGYSTHAQNFPVRFCLEASEDPQFKIATKIADHSGSDYPDPGDVVGLFKSVGVYGRYVRLTVTKSRERDKRFYFCLSKMEVWSGGKDVAQGCPISDSASGNLDETLLTRTPRPQGEEVVTDNPGNVIPADRWKPVAYKAQAPLGGVRLGSGLFKTAMENNIGYLLSSFSVDEMVRPFRERAGKPIPNGLHEPIVFWDTDLPGSSAGRFLMGSGNTVRWMDAPELHHRMVQLINGIEECRETNGYIMAYPPDSIFHSEYAAYTRSWVTQGLIEAGYAGNPKAFELLRGYYDWFDHCSYLPELLRRAGQGVQGMIANTRMYFTPVGKPGDIQVVQRYFQEDYWMDELAKHEPRAIWLYPYDHPHNYLITSLEAYLDQYRATGVKSYLNAALGGWDLYHDDWEHIGGAIAICETVIYPPQSYLLHQDTGEFCGNVFWIRYNQRFHLLYPEEEKFVNEIEKSIYNVALPNQVGTNGILYHANLVGKKDFANGMCHNSCCEGQGTRLFGSLPEYIYSIAKDGLYVDLFAASTITWQQNNQSLQAQMTTQFPFKPEVQLRLTLAKPTPAKIRIRVPAWAAKMMPISVNGVVAVTGKPGSYAVISRTWEDGDTVAFSLPMDFKLTRYTGAEENYSQERYALEYGPILMAIVGALDEQGDAQLALRSEELIKQLKPKPDQPLHFTVEGDSQHEFRPYWEVNEQPFTCFPVIGIPGMPTVRKVEPNDLALAAKGATVTADSEFDQKDGALNAIDGIIPAPGDCAGKRWRSALTPHPHWIEVKLPKPEKIGRVVIRFADPSGFPVSFQGLARVQDKNQVLFDVTGYENWREYRRDIKPVVTDTFRFLIRASANTASAAPQAIHVNPNAAQLGEIELYPPTP
jgi:DUF1680 family protein